MRTFVIALAASFMFFGASSTDARANGNSVSSNLVKPAVGKPAIMDLAPAPGYRERC